MKLKLKIIVATLLVLAVGTAFWLLIRNNGFDVLQPSGVIADEQKNLIITASLLSIIVVVPVFAMTFWIVWKYRATQTRPGKYTPNWASNNIAEAIWWSVPVILIFILGIMIWISSHRLDPYRKLESAKIPLKVQVIAMNWKWLFIYPEQHVASVNFLQIPVDRPVDFELTSDAPMTSFWVPKLGGQVYAMSGMSTQLHLEAHTAGDFTGRNANISGEGYAGMTFTVRAGSDADFSAWVNSASAQPALTDQSYAELAKPSQNVAPRQYRLDAHDLYDTVVMKYMMPASKHTEHHDE